MTLRSNYIEARSSVDIQKKFNLKGEHSKAIVKIQKKTMLYGSAIGPVENEQNLFKRAKIKIHRFSKLLFRNGGAEVKKSARRNGPSTCKK